MTSWQLTCALNTVKTLLPFQRSLRTFKRKIAPPQIAPQHESVVSGGIDHIKALRAAGLELRGSQVLEIGTGWFPIIPLMLRIAGAEHVYMTDLHKLLDAQTVVDAALFVERKRSYMSGDLGVDPEDFETVLAALDANLPLEPMLAALGLTYMSPFAASRQMPRVDAVVSQTVFEHIPPDMLQELLFDIDRGLRPGGLMSHGIDNTDHRSNHDRSLARFDFLKYSDRSWRLLCLDPQDYTNRLRHADYVEILRRIGHEIVSEKTFTDRDGLAALKAAPANERFASRTPEELAIAWTHLVSRKPNRVAADTR